MVQWHQHGTAHCPVVFSVYTVVFAMLVHQGMFSTVAHLLGADALLHEDR